MALQMLATSALSREELLRLPAAINPRTAFRVLGIGRTTGYGLIQDGKFPVPVLRIGQLYRIRTADLLDLLGIEPGGRSHTHDTQPVTSGDIAASGYGIRQTDAPTSSGSDAT